jgi:hypothetical protein
MLLRGVLRGGQERYGGTAQYTGLEVLLRDVEGAEAAACAAAQ